MRGVRFYLRKCKLLLAVSILLLVVVLGMLYSAPVERPQEITLAAARDLAPGEKDPYYISSLAMVWESLVATDKDGHIHGVLAEAWQANEDCTVWRFQLRQGIRF